MLNRLKYWLDQRRTIRRQKETIEVLKKALMERPEVVCSRDVLFLRNREESGGWTMYQKVVWTPRMHKGDLCTKS